MGRKHLTLSEEQQDFIAKNIKQFSGYKIKIFLNRETQETASFGNALANSLKKAGIEVVEISHMEVFGAMPSGLLFYLSKTNQSDIQFAESLADVFSRVGVIKEKETVPTEFTHSDTFIIYITPFT